MKNRVLEHKIIPASLIVLTSIFSLGANAASVSLIANSAFDTNTSIMDTNLGITGFSIESFSDSALLPGLFIEWTNPSVGPSVGPTAVLPNIDTPGPTFLNNHWDDENVAFSTANNRVWFEQPSDRRTDIAERTTFILPANVTRFGIGLANFQSEFADHAILINGVEVIGVLEDLPNFVSGINVRNGYLKIHADQGETILSVAFEVRQNSTTNPVNGINGDGLVFDRLAFDTTVVPIPAPLLLLGSAIIALGGFKRRNS